MNKLVKYHFNLVEVILAIVIMSLGMASIFVLFPAGLNNHRTAMAENSIADMAELVISHIRAQAALKGTADDFGGVGSDFKDESSTPTDPPSGFDWQDVSSGDPWTVKKTSNGVYVVRQLSGPVDDPYVDFAAVVRVYLDDDYEDELFVPVSGGGATYSKAQHSSTWNLGAVSDANLKELSVGGAVMPLIVEISYPADRDYEDRTKVYFRFEIFNELFELKED